MRGRCVRRMLTLRKIKDMDVSERDYKNFDIEESDIKDLKIRSRGSVRLAMEKVYTTKEWEEKRKRVLNTPMP